MDTMSFEELSSFLQEDIFLIPEEKPLYSGGQIKDAPQVKEEREKLEIPEPIMATPKIENTPEQVIEEEITPEPIQVRGNFTKGILVLHEESELLPEVMEMLVKMINACGHSMNEIGLLSSEALGNRSMEDFMALNAHTVLKFGRIKHPINAIPAQLYEIHSEEETEFLFADSLTVISEDRELKSRLWKSLKVLFNITS
ncbi:hypothetical protein Aoki45_05930 [Algoriphagus sp. oki45]|uniref:hypothetical protein n=1 Tax=Algoriphagus sp. oki45 TaxID=3067294 RepID=UPI0027F832D6|nr:hypothetical protein Aoki45_05930 [Algoriphagus sp. oki45]